MSVCFLKATNEVIAKVPKSTQSEMNEAVDSCAQAFKTWSKTTPIFRQQIMFKLQHLIKENMKELAKNITKEQGKTLPDAEGDVLRGLQVVEHACSLTFLQMGSTLPGIAKDMDCHSYRVPLGVTAGITPFNFPAMIPLWMFPLATACGNTMLIKPSEKDPGACMMLVELAKQAGLPEGVVNVIHGAHAAVDFICDNPTIRAISFVGSDQAGKYIYERGSKNGKRVQSNMGAKNHGVIMPDANKENALNQLVGASFGAAGQRCMALTTAVFVGDSKDWIPDLVEKVKKLKVNAGHEPGTDIGPVISKDSRSAFMILLKRANKRVLRFSWTVVTSMYKSTRTVTLLDQLSSTMLRLT
jgi:malonate-semialdehyde dehydrogenase (acetylating)/methylmalonate-semialdehyde dehydrogenase